MQKSAGGGTMNSVDMPYILLSRGLIVAFIIAATVLVRMAWKRNRYDDRAGFREVDASPPATAAKGASS
jgi:hypothetical protein